MNRYKPLFERYQSVFESECSPKPSGKGKYKKMPSAKVRDSSTGKMKTCQKWVKVKPKTTKTASFKKQSMKKAWKTRKANPTAMKKAAKRAKQTRKLNK